MARVYSRYTHMTGSFLVFSEHSSFTFCCYRCCCYFENEPSLLEDILHKVTLTKITSDVTQASGWARLSFYFFFFPLIYFVSVLLINVNWDGKEKHHVSVSFYWLASLTRERHKHQPDLGASKFRAVEANESHLHFPTQACLRGVQDGAGGPGRAQPARGLSNAVVTFRGETASEACESRRSSITTRAGPVVR